MTPHDNSTGTDLALRQIFTHAPFAITYLDSTMRVILLNPTMESLVGFTLAETRGRHCYDCWGQYANDVTRSGPAKICDNCPITATLHHGASASYEREINGKVIGITTTPIRDREGNITGALEVGYDITDRHSAAQALRESEERYRLLFDSSPNLLCIADASAMKEHLDSLDRQGREFEDFFSTSPHEIAASIMKLRITEVNQASLDRFGAASQQEFINNLFTIIGPETFSATAEGISAMGRGETSHEREAVLYHLQGAKIFGILRWSVTPGFEQDYSRLVLSFTDITERKNSEVKLAQHREQLQQLSSRLIDTEENERRRIARELHDQIGQQLTALGLNLHILEQSVPPEQRSRIDDSLELIKSMAGQVRDIMENLRPPVLDDYGLRAALRWYASLFTKRTGIEVLVHARIDRLPANLETALFRISQEALNNVIKHARASRVEIHCAMTGNLLALTIEDNGCGFMEPDQTRLPGPQTWGLLSMQERIESWGGKLTVASAPGKGTVITAEVAL